MQIIGTTTYVEVEGGFWGILGDDGVPLPSHQRIAEGISGGIPEDQGYCQTIQCSIRIYVGTACGS